MKIHYYSTSPKQQYSVSSVVTPYLLSLSNGWDTQSLQLSQHVALWIFLVASKPVLQFISTLVLWGIYLTLLLASSMEYYGQYVKQIIVTVLIATLVNETAHTSTC